MTTWPKAVQEPMLDLLWSVWTELGVAGLQRSHEAVLVDLEPLILLSSLFLTHDARLRDEVLRWCRRHHDVISRSRLQGLLKRAPAAHRQAFADFAATLQRDRGPSWPLAADGTAWSCAVQSTAPDIPYGRPALAGLRVRGLVGANARGDVVTALLYAGEHWLRASQLHYLGYSKRAVAGVLNTLHRTAVAECRMDGNAHTFRLHRRQEWQSILQLEPLAVPRWDALIGLVLVMVDHETVVSQVDTVQRVEAQRAVAAMQPLVQRLPGAVVPVLSANQDPWSALSDWIGGCISDQAQGSMGQLLHPL